ncbi:MAG: carbamoyltransferase HypF [Bacillota bacterium]
MAGHACESKKIRRLRIRAEGIVQGVGFRPFIYNLARQFGLAGFVLNDGRGVMLEVEGAPDDVDRFSGQILKLAPPRAVVERLRCRELTPAGDCAFTIIPSASEARSSVFVSPDLATCRHCLNELFDPANRRHRYPFINCTGCGPRFTIVSGVPYDRDKTTMKAFSMCRDCLGEYNDPSDRRFHAQPNACPECGPRALILDAGGMPVPCRDVVAEAARILRRGLILAIKGIGGYHLACNAGDNRAVNKLRRRKNREEKPLALMVRDLETAGSLCRLEPGAIEALPGHRRPIVLLEKREPNGLASAVAPGQRYLGVMLPYSPLHHLLLKESGLVLVLTSGNKSGEPIACGDEEALTNLAGIADYFLVHNRPIQARCDDSVVKIHRGVEVPVRRARGYVPEPVRVPFRFEKRVLACGAQMKNTFALAGKDRVFLSQHLGDLENPMALAAFEESVLHFQKLFSIYPELIAHDLHPGYLSTQYALSRADASPVGIQHHHAHVVSCMAENGLRGRVIGVAFDGTGYGEDGKLWGGEFLLAEPHGYRREARFRYMPLPGGEQAVRQPWRLAAVYLNAVYGEGFLELNIPFVKKFDPGEWAILIKMIDSGINCPETCGVGRLFDAVAALAGLRMSISYEGQAATELESIADESCGAGYDFTVMERRGLLEIDPAPVIAGVVEDLLAGRGLPEISARFHNALAGVVLSVCSRIREAANTEEVVLSGGVFQNLLLLDRAQRRLEEAGFKVYTHRRVPANDGGISLGQAVIANERWKRCALESP